MAHCPGFGYFDLIKKPRIFLIVMKRKNTRAIDIPTDVIDRLLRAGLKWNAYKKEITKSAVRYSEIEMFARRTECSPGARGR